MNKKLLGLSFMILAMGFLYKYSLRSMETTSSSSSSFITMGPVVTLVSSDGKEFQIARQAAEYSKTIADMIEDFGINTPLPLPGLKSQALARMISIMHDLPNVNNIDNYVIDLSASHSNHYLIMIAQYASYLQINELTTSLIRLYIFRKLKEKLATKEELIQSVKSNFLRKDIDEEYDFVKTSAGFAALKKTINNGILDLNKSRISNVYGLNLVGDSESITQLRLATNAITNIPSGPFQRFVNLKKLFLGSNAIAHISPGAFKGLSKLEVLGLSGNQLTDISREIFEGLSSLQVLSLYKNLLTRLEAEAFQDLSRLNMLILIGNPFNPPPTKDEIKDMLPNGGQWVRIILTREDMAEAVASEAE